MKTFAWIVVVTFLSACGSNAATSSQASVTATTLKPKGQTVNDVVVERVVDGDTFTFRSNGEDVTVRMIGLDTPETVKPNTPVACYGPEASDFTKSQLSGKKVTLEFDASQGTTDKYGRTLAYVWLQLPNGELAFFNGELVKQGFAWQKQYAGPYAWENELVADQRTAQQAHAGLWGAC